MFLYLRKGNVDTNSFKSAMPAALTSWHRSFPSLFLAVNMDSALSQMREYCGSVKGVLFCNCRTSVSEPYRMRSGSKWPQCSMVSSWLKWWWEWGEGGKEGCQGMCAGQVSERGRERVQTWSNNECHTIRKRSVLNLQNQIQTWFCGLWVGNVGFGSWFR